MGLTGKQRAFVEEYLACWNATEAARSAGYSERTARAIGCENLTKPDIIAEIDRRVSEKAMTANEVLLRLAEQARGEYAQYIDEFGMVDIKRMKADGRAHLIKKVSLTRHSRTVEFHDAQSALFLLAKSTGVAPDRMEHTGKDGGPIITKAYTVVSPDDWPDPDGTV